MAKPKSEMPMQSSAEVKELHDDKPKSDLEKQCNANKRSPRDFDIYFNRSLFNNSTRSLLLPSTPKQDNKKLIPRVHINPIQMELLKAGEQEDLKKISELLDAGASPILEGYSGIPIIYTLCITSKFKAAKYIFQRRPDAIHAITDNKLTTTYALISAIQNTHEYVEGDNATLKVGYELIEFALDGIDINEKVGSGKSILFCCKNVELLKMILKHKPNPFLRDELNRTALQSHMSNVFETESCSEVREKFLIILAQYEKSYKVAKSVENGLPNFKRDRTCTA